MSSEEKYTQAKLTENEKVLMRLLALPFQPYTALAEKVGVPVGTVKSRINRARNKLKGLLS